MVNPLEITPELLEDLPAVRRYVDLRLREISIIYLQVYREEIFRELLEGDGSSKENLGGVLNHGYK